MGESRKEFSCSIISLFRLNFFPNSQQLRGKSVKKQRKHTSTFISANSCPLNEISPERQSHRCKTFYIFIS